MHDTVCKNLGQLQVNRLLVLLVLIYYLFHARLSKRTLLWSLGVPSLQIKIEASRLRYLGQRLTGRTVVNRVEWLWGPSDSFVTCFLRTWRRTTFNRIPIILILLTNKNVGFIYSVIICEQKQRIVLRQKGLNKNCNTVSVYFWKFKIEIFL